MDFDLRVHGETILRVQHALMALPREDGEANPLKVRSHPQALAQCENFLKSNGLAAQAGVDTAGSAKEIADGNLRDVAAICSRLAEEWTCPNSIFQCTNPHTDSSMPCSIATK